MLESDRRRLFRIAVGGAAALAVGGVAVPVSAASRDPKPGHGHLTPVVEDTPGPARECETETFKGRKLRICPDAPVVDGVMTRGVFVDGRALLLMVHGKHIISVLNQHVVHCTLREAAHDAVNLLDGAQLELRWCRFEPPGDLREPRYGRKRLRAPYTRRSVTALSTAQRADLVAGLLALKANGTYDFFVDLHRRAFTNAAWRAHMHPGFLPWHRALLLLLEAQLQAVKPSVTLPYWDWSAQQSATGVPFVADLLGGNGYFGADADTAGRPRKSEVTTGPFAFRGGRWPITVREDSRDYLRREMGRNTRAATLSGPDHVSWVMGQQEYDRAPYDTTVSTFRNNLEGWWTGQNAMHNRTHVWIGGNMGPASSPNDPAFFLNHCYVDRLWAQWQGRYPDAAHFLPTDLLDVPMEPFLSELDWSVTPREMLKYQDSYVYA